MPPRSRTTVDEPTAEVPADADYVVMERPGRWVEAEPGKVVWEEGAHPCPEGCGVHPIHRTATHASCDHGAWKFTEPAGGPSGAGEKPSAEALRVRAAELLTQADQLDGATAAQE